jgi:hypothetical protein
MLLDRTQLAAWGYLVKIAWSDTSLTFRISLFPDNGLC